jgi:LUD domain
MSTAAPVATSTDQLETVAEKLRARNIEAVVVDSAAAARTEVLDRLPDAAEIHWGKSKTLDDIGLTAELMDAQRHDLIRPRIYQMDRATQGREIRKLGAAPDIELGSVAAITQDGALVAASATGSQLGPYAAGAGRLILVVGSQKLVPDLDAAMARIDETVFPYENEQVRAKMGVDTRLEKVLVIFGEWNPGRTTVILVREPVGV